MTTTMTMTTVAPLNSGTAAIRETIAFRDRRPDTGEPLKVVRTYLFRRVRLSPPIPRSSRMKSQLIIIAFTLILLAVRSSPAADTIRKTIWQGTLHLGDSPEKYPGTTSAGFVMQIPCKLDYEKRAKLAITTRDVETLASEGHYVELLAHYEDIDGPAREYVVETLRIKEEATDADIERTFELDPRRGLQSPPAYYSLRIKIDSAVRFSLWDDFLVKRIDIEQ